VKIEMGMFVQVIAGVIFYEFCRFSNFDEIKFGIRRVEMSDAINLVAVFEHNFRDLEGEFSHVDRTVDVEVFEHGQRA